MPVDADAEPLEEEAQVLDHVVGLALRITVTPVVQRRRHEGVLGDGVAALGEHDRAGRGDAGGDLGLVAPVGGLDLEAERPQGRHVRLDGAGAEVAAAGVRQLELAARCSSGPRNMMTERVRRAASSSIRVRSSSAGGTISRSLSSLSHRVWTPRLSSTSSSRLTSSIRATLRSVVRPWLSSEAQSSATPAFFDDFTSMLPLSVVGPVTRRWVGPGAEGDDLGVEGLADAGHHLEGDVLVAALDAVHRALAGVEHVGELLLGPPAVLAGVADELADAGQVVLSHAATVSQI